MARESRQPFPSCRPNGWRLRVLRYRFLRNCLNFKLQEVFLRHGLEAEFLVVISRGDLAWARSGFAAGDFAERHGQGVFALASSV